MKPAPKPLPLYRLSLALLTIVLLLAAYVITSHQRDIKHLRLQRDFARLSADDYRDRYEQAQDELARYKQINAIQERWLSDAARNDQQTKQQNDQQTKLIGVWDENKDPFKPVAPKLPSQ